MKRGRKTTIRIYNDFVIHGINEAFGKTGMKLCKANDQRINDALKKLHAELPKIETPKGNYSSLDFTQIYTVSKDFLRLLLHHGCSKKNMLKTVGRISTGRHTEMEDKKKYTAMVYIIVFKPKGWYLVDAYQETLVRYDLNQHELTIGYHAAEDIKNKLFYTLLTENFGYTKIKTL